MNWNAQLYDNSHSFVSKYGEGILSYLNAQPGEHILDLGCGTGDLTYKIVESGASVVGIDSSVEMITKAQSKFPEIEFHSIDARELPFNQQFDAIFSNAVLHWINDPDLVIQKMYNALKPNGRIVVEFGGKGNNAMMLSALREVLVGLNYVANAQINFWFYPSIGEYAGFLEKHNFRVTHAEHFDRATPLKGEDGMKDWFRMFGKNFFSGIPEDETEDILTQIEDRLRSTHYKNGVWYADYKRIRAIAVKERPRMVL